jgi:hypothetical protein
LGWRDETDRAVMMLMVYQRTSSLTQLRAAHSVSNGLSG